MSKQTTKSGSSEVPFIYYIITQGVDTGFVVGSDIGNVKIGNFFKQQKKNFRGPSYLQIPTRAAFM